GRRADRTAAGEALFDSGNEPAPHPALTVVVPAHHVPPAIDDRAHGVHDGEDRDLGLTDLAECAAFPGGLALVEREELACGRRPAGAAATERKNSFPGCAQSGAPELIVGAAGVVA